jgi:Uma2 family endonuclease
MRAVNRCKLVSPEVYLEEEMRSPVKREYLGGLVYSRPDERILHNIIVGNVFGSLHMRLRGKKCEVWNSDTKIRLRLPGEIRFYYPDVSVVCRSNPPDYSYQDEPMVIVEVVSKGTRRIDEGEKKSAYFSIPTLDVYMLVEQDSAFVTVFRRTATGFEREVHDGLNAVIPLREIETELPLAGIYEGVEFVPEPDATE